MRAICTHKCDDWPPVVAHLRDAHTDAVSLHGVADRASERLDGPHRPLQLKRRQLDDLANRHTALEDGPR
eukprot:357179-Chlamydomonas_euryale.AAC.4